MNPENKRYILENIGKKTVKQIAGDLGLKERVVRRFLENERSQDAAPEKAGPARGRFSFTGSKTPAVVVTERQTAFAAMRIPAIAVVFLIIILGLIAYANSFNNEFVFDDVQQVMNNTVIRSFGNIRDAFTHDLTYYGGEKEGKFYRPIQTLTYMIDHHFSGTNPFGYHITNTLLHIMVCILLFFVISTVTSNRLLSSLVTLLYLVHPTHTEAVAYISGRADSLCVIFLLAMIIFQFKYWSAVKARTRAVYYSAIMICLLLALLSKELSVIFPLLLMLTEYCLRNKERYEGLLGKRIFFYLPLIALIIVWFLIKNAVVSTEAMVRDPRALQLTVTLRTTSRIIFDYLKLSFFPLNLHMEYKLPFPNSLFQDYYLGPFVFMLFFVPFGFYLWRRGRFDINYRIIFFGLGWFIVALLPYINIFFHLNAPFSEHWLYIPEMGLILSVIYLLLYYAKKIEPLGKITILLCLVYITAFSYLTIKQNAVWKDKMTFYAYTLKHAPFSAKTYNNLAIEYIKKEDYIKAKELLEKAIKIEPEFKNAVENLKMLKDYIGERGT